MDGRPGRRRRRAAGQGRARLRLPRQAHAAGQRQLARRAHPRRTSTWSPTPIAEIVPDGHRRTADGTRPRGRRDRLRHRLPRQPLPVADGHRRARRRRARRAVGRRARPPTSASPCPNFPNLFCLYGPGTNLAHGGSIIFHSECQVRYVMGCLAALLAGDGAVDGVPPARCTTTTTSASRPSSTPWSGATRRSATAGTATPTGRIYILSPVAPRRLLGLDPGPRPRRLRAHLT